MDSINFAKQPTVLPSSKPKAAADAGADAQHPPHESFHPQEQLELQSRLAVPSRGVAWAVAAQLSGTTWSWIKKIYPECDDSDDDAETCLYSALGELAPPAFEHSNRVGQLAARFARHLGLTQGERRNLGRAVRFKECGLVALQMHLWSEEEQEEVAQAIQLGGAFHDIGKIAVSRDILEKPGPLTSEERQLIELHPLIGEALLQKIPSAHALLPAVRNHHERWDGKGYVDGLAGEAIPFPARIIAIVDSFDAMTEGRPYRGELTEQEACLEILAGAGSHFDPQLAEQFVRLFEVNPA